MKRFFVFLITFAIIGLIVYAVVILPKNNDGDDDSGTGGGGEQQENLFSASFNLSDYYGESAPASQTDLQAGVLLTEPAEPNRPGYSFDGWYTNLSNEQSWNFSVDTIDSNIILYAKWSLETYTTTFNLAGGEGVAPESQERTYLNLLTKPDMNPSTTTTIDNPTKSGYIFAGWWVGTPDTYTQEWNFSSDLLSSNLTLYAGWGTIGASANFSYIELNNCIKLLGYTSASVGTDLILPSTINGKYVLSIAENAFSENATYNINEAESVTLPMYLTTINEGAFYGCDAVGDIVIPNTVTSIGKMAFYGCENIYDINLGSGIKNIGEMAFYQCLNLSSYSSDTLSIPSSVLKIEKNAFSISGNAILSLNLNIGLVYIGESAFAYAKISVLAIPNTVEIIGNYAFRSNISLTTLVLGKGLKTIGLDAFLYVNNNFCITSLATIPPTLLSSRPFGDIGTTRQNFFIVVEYSLIDTYKTATNWSYYASRVTQYMPN